MQERARKLINLIVILFIMIFMQGCMNLAMTSAQVVYNRHSIQKNLTDQYITMQAFKALNLDNDQFKDANIEVATFNREVLLTGQVPESWQQTKAEKIIKKIPDIKQIHNSLIVAAPSSSLTRFSDAWITAKVKAKFIASDDLDATQIKVVTENGVVYLMGVLWPSEAEAAADLANETDGVQKVVKIFSYLSVSKTYS